MAKSAINIYDLHQNILLSPIHAIGAQSPFLQFTSYLNTLGYGIFWHTYNIENLQLTTVYECEHLYLEHLFFDRFIPVKNLTSVTIAREGLNNKVMSSNIVVYIPVKGRTNVQNVDELSYR